MRIIPPSSASLFQPLHCLICGVLSRCGARHFWRRLPANGGKQDPDTVRLWRIGQALWRKDSISCVTALTEESWADGLVPIVKLLEERFRESQLRLIGNNSVGRTNINVLLLLLNMEW